MARSSAQNRDSSPADTGDGNARPLGWRTMLLVIAAALALNILVGQFVQRVLQLPVYLDSIGTIVVGALFGPVVGALTGMISNLLWGLLFQLPEIVPFAITAAWIGWAAGYAGQLNVFRQKITIGNVFLVAATGLFVGAIGALISAPIVAHLFGGATGSGTDRLVNYFGTLGATVLQQASLQTFISDPVDKVVSFLIAWLIWRPVSRRIGARELLRISAFDRVSAIGKTILLSVVTLIAAWIFYPAFGRTIFTIFFIAVIVSAYMGGMWSGLLATAIGAVAAIAMLLSPMGGGVQVQDLLQLAIFLFVSLFIVFITDRLTAQRQALEVQKRALEEQKGLLEEQKSLLEASNSGLRSANARIGAIMDSVNETLMLVSPQRVMSNINARFATMFDTPVEAVQDKSIDDADELLGQVFEKPELFTGMVEKHATVTDGDFNETLGQKWPVPRELALYSTPVRTGEEFLGRLYLFRDITRERELARMQKEFVSMVSHELRTPLTSIRGFTEMVLDGDAGEINEEQEEYLGIVMSNAERLIALINDILDVSRMESGRVDIKPTTIEISALVNPVVLSMRPLLQGKEQSISANVEPGLPPVQADVDKITQVLTNFVSNAHKYNNPGGWIRIDATREGNMARIGVVDNGFGISEEDQKKLFQRFFRVENSLTRNIGGTGLGLNITKTIVEMHGGQVQVVSAPGEGSTFSFTLPLAEGASAHQYVSASVEKAPAVLTVDDGLTTKTPKHENTGSQPTDALTHRRTDVPKRILIVEDDPDIARLLADQLHAEGYTTTIAASGEAALEEVARELPDLITLDIQLPGMDGIEVAQRLAMDPATTDLPVLVVSVTDKDPRLKQFGMRTLSKPLDRDALLANVSELLEEDEKRPVLVIDDDPDVRELLRANLTRAGFEVVLAQDGREGIELAQVRRPGLILLDLMMPGVDGFSVLQALKQNSATLEVPVVAMTGHDDVRLRARARLLSLGAADLVAKPLDMKSLLAEVQILIQTEE